MRDVKTVLRILLFLLLLSTLLQAAPDNAPAKGGAPYLYGTVLTIDGESYTGQLRWGKEEATWQDLFNSSKTENPFIKYLDRDDMAQNEGKRSGWDFRALWQDRGGSWSASSNHSFALLFGDISSIEVSGGGAIRLKLRNGEVFTLRGGSNDVGAKITVLDQDFGKLEVDWRRIDRISFSQMPEKTESQLGEVLYGIVKTQKGEFEGYIQWDEDETLSEDRLDGDTPNGDMSIPFGNIKSITRGGRGSDVVLKSGRKVYLTGSNDVDADNRGIIVKNPDWGRINISWREFESITFTEPKEKSMSYQDFPTPKRLEGKVRTREGKILKGLIVFDLDESWDTEVLDGKDGGMEYKIPFRRIKSLRPKNEDYTSVVLTNGTTLILGDSNDVSSGNDGILIFKNKDDKAPEYIAWKNVEEVTFQ